MHMDTESQEWNGTMGRGNRLPDIDGHEDIKIKVCRGQLTLYYHDNYVQFFILNLQKLCTIQLSPVDNYYCYSFHLLRRLNSRKKKKYTQKLQKFRMKCQANNIN